jgi:hypothetical protein
MEINDYILKIKKLGACEAAVLAAHNYQTSQELWDKCYRGDWMLWLIGKLSGKPESEKRKKLVITACKCARLTLTFAGENKDDTEKCIVTAENWAKNVENVTIDDVRAAADAAYAAAYVAADAAAYVAADAADAAYAADAAAYAADAAAYVAAYAAYAADAADAAKKQTLKQCADIVRKDYPDIQSLFNA